MSQRHPQQRSRRYGRNQVEGGVSSETRSSSGRSTGGRRSHDDSYTPYTYLTRLIAEDAPLYSNSHLLLMYGPFQAEMPADSEQGVAAWLKECVQKHGIPSLVRFDQRQRAQVFRRDQFQPWFDEILKQAS
jgi:hypothetical protein